MNKWILCCFVIVVSCTSKKKKDIEPMVSVVSLLKGQVKHVDSTAKKFQKIETDGQHSDTTNISREDFDKYARDFLVLPDISSNKLSRHYDQANSYDDVMGKVILTYTAQEEGDEIRRETLIVNPKNTGESEVMLVNINRIREEKEGTIEQEMTWHLDSHFQVVTKTIQDKKPEIIRTMIVKWE